jgi:long-chain acyl-CoA synthetase
MTRQDLLNPNLAPLFCDYLDLHVRQRGDRKVVTCREADLSWAELGRRAYKVANRLAGAGLGRGDSVVVLLDNRLETVEIILGIIRSGATIVPINPTISDDAIARQIVDCGAKALFAIAREAARVDGVTSHLPLNRRVVVDTDLDGWCGFAAWCHDASDAVPPVICEPDDILTIVYSSGTTGIPKGIAHTHLTRTRNLLEFTQAFRATEDSVWLCTLGMYSNAGIGPFLMALLAGGSAVLLEKFDPAAFLQAVERNRATHFFVVPLMLRMLLEHPSFDSIDVASVEFIVVGGTSIEPDLKERSRRGFGCVLLELYGLTEGFFTITSTRDPADKAISVGRPCAGADMKILRDDGTEAAIGEPGEIVGLTQSITVGYINRPEETAAAFFSDERSRRWFRTGDIGKVDQDGFLYYVGRKKDLIVSGGQNIYPGDIEAVAATHPDVDQIAVVGMPDPKWDETPVAVVVLRESAAIACGDLREWINDRVGKRQRVTSVIAVASLPVNALGKVLKRELREKLLANANADAAV